MAAYNAHIRKISVFYRRHFSTTKWPGLSRQIGNGSHPMWLPRQLGCCNAAIEQLGAATSGPHDCGLVRGATSHPVRGSMRAACATVNRLVVVSAML
jgi:hypothetical protein